MSEASDDAQNFALAVVAGVVALVVAGVIALAVAGTGPRRAGAVDVPAAAAAGVEVEQVDFDAGAHALSADAQAVLARVAEAARAGAGTLVLISAFHDAHDVSGDAARNAELAQQRALAVRHALEANGVAPERLMLSRPERVPGGADPRAARRVELRVQ